MKVTAIYLYPIKGLRAITLPSSPLTPQGLLHDRTFMLCRVRDDGTYQKLQLDGYPRCARFSQELVESSVRVRWLGETEVEEQLVEGSEGSVLDVPLDPDLEELEKTVMNLHQSKVHAYLMGPPYDAFFTSHFGFPTVLLHIGDGKRPILGTFSPRSRPPTSTGWFSTLTNRLPSFGRAREADWLTFTDCAPFMLTTDASMKNVRERFESTVDVEMYKFRPNIVLDGQEAWEEDFWSELSTDTDGSSPTPLFTLSKLCNRCTSLNVDYGTGAMSTKASGSLLKKLSKDRRVDTGNKWSPVFGRYGFLSDSLVEEFQGHGDAVAGGALILHLGDQIQVTGVNTERPAWDWPIRDESAARFYEP